MASDAVHRSPWSVSINDAVPDAPQNAAETPAYTAGYNCGNNDSTTFFRMMNDSIAEAERLRQQCRTAASNSAARNQEEKIYLGHFHKHVEAAKAVAQFAKTAEQTDASGTVVDRLPADVPACLGHLSKPQPQDSGDDTSMPWDFQKELSTETVLLPGAVDSFEDTPRALPDEAAALPPGVKALSLAATPRTNAGNESSRQLQQAPYGEYGGLDVDADADEDAIGSTLHPSEAMQDYPVGIRGQQSPRHDGEEESSDFASSDEDGTESSDRWPPKPPLLRFKMRVQFSQRFKTSQNKAIFEEMNKDLHHKMVEKKQPKEMQDMLIGWINTYFAFNIKTEMEFEICFPIVVLTMLDAIYPKRVRWREVDWRYQHKRALLRNHRLMSAIWMEVNMEKAREFRVENTSLRAECMLETTVAQKLDFLRLMKRWFQQRINAEGAYDALAKRREYVAQCKQWGHTVVFPPWVLYEKEAPAKAPVSGAAKKLQEFHKMPEYKRLIWFLGSPEHQTM